MGYFSNCSQWHCAIPAITTETKGKRITHDYNNVFFHDILLLIISLYPYTKPMDSARGKLMPQ